MLVPEGRLDGDFPHARVALFIEDLALGHDLRVEGLPLGEPPRQALRGANNQVHGKWRVDSPPDTSGLVMLVARRHDDQNIDVAVRVRRALGMRAEKNDPVRLESLGDLPSEPADHAHRHIGAPIHRSRRFCRALVFLVPHSHIVHCRPSRVPAMPPSKPPPSPSPTSSAARTVSMSSNSRPAS